MDIDFFEEVDNLLESDDMDMIDAKSALKKLLDEVNRCHDRLQISYVYELDSGILDENLKFNKIVLGWDDRISMIDIIAIENLTNAFRAREDMGGFDIPIENPDQLSFNFISED